ncbi:MAG: stage II sporulation protein D [Firmicutes bacterium]|nr:stage II sporulation protein D [Bacillota bacterium]
MKKMIGLIMIIIFYLVGIPLFIGLLFGGGLEILPGPAKGIDVPDTVDVWLSDEKKVVEVDFEDYVTRVTASEMPADFDEEALKAQSVAARTYVMAKIIKYEDKKPESHPKAPVCDSTHCQVYKTEKQLIESHSEGWEKSFEKLKKACKATEGQMLYFDGELVMQPLFFSSSGGQTENSEDVFSGAYPYLVSVSSPYEEGASHSNEKKEFSINEIKKALKKTYSDREPGTISINNIKIVSRTAGGRVESMQIGEARYKGTEVRNALGLSSTLFNISFKDEQVVFTSNGYGHGVGLSQYGANGMAKEGYKYKEILMHYYTGTQVY